jgi:hypothetical protein
MAYCRLPPSHKRRGANLFRDLKCDGSLIQNRPLSISNWAAGSEAGASHGRIKAR